MNQTNHTAAPASAVAVARPAVGDRSGLAPLLGTGLGMLALGLAAVMTGAGAMAMAGMGMGG